MDFDCEKICLACLKGDANNSVFEEIVTDSGEQTSLSKMFRDVTSFAVHEGDCLPMQMCDRCDSSLRKAYNFKRQCERSFGLLMKHSKSAVSHADDSDSEYKFTVEIEPSDCIKRERDDEESQTTNVESIVMKSDCCLAVTLFPDEFKETVFKKKNAEAEDGELRIKREHGPKNAKRKPYKVKSALGIDINSLKIDQKKFQCNMCQRVLKTRTIMVRHLENHYGIKKDFFCIICKKYFSRKWSHMQLHTRSKNRFQCDNCGKTFARKGALSAHMKIHYTKKNHVCEDCGKVFLLKERLAVHKKIHSEIKEFLCQFCSKGFRFQKNLISHIRYIHTNDRRYRCDRCDKRFVTSDALKKHERRHLGIKNYRCDLCDKSFVLSSGLASHRRVHTKEKPYGCRSCDVRFGRSDHRKRHETTAHGARGTRDEF